MRSTVLLTLGACGFGLTENAPADSEPPDNAVVIGSIDPSVGPPTGGTVVTVTGQGFVGDVVVELGGAAMGEVTVVSDEELVFTTPRVGREMNVDLRVTSDVGTDVVAGGFVFDDDATNPDTGGGGDTGHTGETGTAIPDGTEHAFVRFGSSVVACPDCFSLSSNVVVTAEAVFHDDADTTWTSWVPASGTCVVDPDTGGPDVLGLDVGDTVSLETGATSIDLAATRGNDGIRYAATGLTSADLTSSVSLDLTTDGGADANAFTVEDALQTPSGGIDALYPSQLLNTTTSDAFVAVLFRTEALIAWSPSGGTSPIVVVMEVYDSARSTLQGTIVCTEPDDGNIAISSTYVGAYPQDSKVVLSVHRYDVGTFALPGGGVGETETYQGVVGTAILR